jgi:ATP/maltotriose-dependent transcriptional regulator MalT
VALGVAGRHVEAEAVLAGWPPIEGSSIPATSRRLGRGLVRHMGERPAEALPDLRAVAEHPGHRPMRERISALAHLADVEILLGSWDEAVAHGEIALGLAVDSGYTALEPVCRAVLATAMVLRGQVEEASSLLDGGPAPDPDDLAGRSLLARARSLAALSQDHLTGVLDACLPLEREVAGQRLRGPQALQWRPHLAEALVALGRHAEARSIVDDLVALTERANRPVSRAVARSLDGRCAAAEGRRDRALDAVDEAVALASGAGNPFEEARALEARGLVRAELLGPGAAVADLRAAAEAYGRLGASQFLRRVEQVLGSADDRPGGAALATPTALTAKEEAVAGLVVAGRSNREVAAELFVSVKTVEYHLGNIYAKVGVRSRTELASRWHSTAPAGVTHP